MTEEYYEDNVAAKDKELTDLIDYTSVLPRASEMFAIYQPLVPTAASSGRCAKVVGIGGNPEAGWAGGTRQSLVEL
jgi:hypothetical protein